MRCSSRKAKTCGHSSAHAFDTGWISTVPIAHTSCTRIEKTSLPHSFGRHAASQPGLLLYVTQASTFGGMDGRPLVFGQCLRRFLVLPATGPELATGNPDFRFRTASRRPLQSNASHFLFLRNRSFSARQFARIAARKCFGVLGDFTAARHPASRNFKLL